MIFILDINSDAISENKCNTFCIANEWMYCFIPEDGL